MTATQQTYASYPPGPPPRPPYYAMGPHGPPMAPYYHHPMPPHGGNHPPMPPHAGAMYPPPPKGPLPVKNPATTKEAENHHKKDDQSEPAAPKEDGGQEGGKGGLDLLASLALPTNGNSNNKTKEADATAAAASNGEKPIKPKKPAKKKKGDDSVGSAGKGEMLFVEQVRDTDVLCGRGGKSNHHPGNKRYRQVVSEMKRTYQTTGAKTAKTDLSRAIVEHVVGYGGRFIKRDDRSGQYFLLTKAQARRKTSQALRETKELKWTV